MLSESTPRLSFTSDGRSYEWEIWLRHKQYIASFEGMGWEDNSTLRALFPEPSGEGGLRDHSLVQTSFLLNMFCSLIVEKESYTYTMIHRPYGRQYRRNKGVFLRVR